MSGSRAKEVPSDSASCSQRSPASRIAAAGWTDRSSEARALASETAAVASSQASSAGCAPALSRATAERALSSSSLEARTNSSGFPAKSAAASGGKQFLPHPLVGLQRGLQGDA